MTHDNGAYVNVAGVDLHPDWGVLHADYPYAPRSRKWHLGTYECETSMCGRGADQGFDQCEPLSSIDPADLCRECVRYVRAHNIKMAES